MALGNEDVACRMVLLSIHAHAESEHQLDAFLVTAASAVETAIEGALQQHPGVDLLESEMGDEDFEEDFHG